jgi:hypothetical protein
MCSPDVSASQTRHFFYVGADQVEGHGPVVLSQRRVLRTFEIKFCKCGFSVVQNLEIALLRCSSSIENLHWRIVRDCSRKALLSVWVLERLSSFVGRREP